MDMQFVRGRRANLVSVGWENHVLQCEFKGGRRYQYAPVPQEVKDKLLRSPYPDHLWTQLKKKNSWLHERVDTPPSKPLPLIDYGEIPF